MNPDEKITPVQTDDNGSDCSGDSTVEQPVIPENNFEAQTHPPDQALLNVQSTPASSQDVQSKSSEIINVSQELNLQTEIQSPSNSPQSTSKCVKSNLEDSELRTDESRISSEQNFQSGIQTLASQSVSKVKCVDDTTGIQSEHVDIYIFPQSEPFEAENLTKEVENIAIKRVEDEIEELSYPLSSTTNPSSPKVEIEKAKDSSKLTFWESRIKIARDQLNRFDCFILLIVTSLGELACIVLYFAVKLGVNDVLLSYIIAYVICWSIALFMEKELLTARYYSLCPCCERNKAESEVKQSQRAPPVEDLVFKHEVVDVENMKDSPAMFEKTPGSLDTFSFPFDMPSIASAEVHGENIAKSPHAYDQSFASGACGFEPGLREGSTVTPFTDCLPESQRVTTAEVHKETHESAESPPEVVKKYPPRRDNSSESEEGTPTDP